MKMQKLAEIAETARTAVGDLLGLAKDHITRAHEAVRAKVAEYERAVSYRQTLIDSLAPRADVLANYDRELDALVEGFPASRALALVQSTGRVSMNARGQVDGLTHP